MRRRTHHYPSGRSGLPRRYRGAAGGKNSSAGTPNLSARHSTLRPRPASCRRSKSAGGRSRPRRCANSHPPTARRMKKAKPILVLIVKLLVSVGLLGYFLARIHIERFLQTFANAKFSYIAIALLVYLATQVVSAMRWTALARPLGVNTPFKDMARYYLIGMFFNLFAPGTVGGDVSRVYYLVRDENARVQGRSVPTMNAAMSVLMDRAIGMIVLVWLGAAGLLLFPYYAVPHSARIATFLLSIGFLGGGTPPPPRFRP